MRVGFLILAEMVALSAVACSCDSWELAKACQVYQKTSVIFRGRVIDHNRNDGSGTGPPAYYRLQVLEAFKGLPEGATEVFVGPAGGCNYDFLVNRDYLVYLTEDRPTLFGTVAARVLQSASGAPAPAVWREKLHLPFFRAHMCDPTRPVQKNDPDLTYLRAASAIRAGSDGWIEGRAVQNLRKLPAFTADFAGAGDAKIQIISTATGKQIEARAKLDGAFQLDRVAPGRYAVVANSPTLGVGRLLYPEAPWTSPNNSVQAATVQIDVPAGGCAVIHPSFQASSSISGKVMTAEGKPAGGVPVGVDLPPTAGKKRTLSYGGTTSEADGSFKILNVPAGPVVVVANGSGVPSTAVPFEAVFAQNPKSSQASSVFRIQPGEHLTGVAITLPKPVSFGTLLVDVLWPDGSPALRGARASASLHDRYAAGEVAPGSSNRVDLKLALGRTHEIAAEWFPGMMSGFLPTGRAKRMIDFTRDGLLIEIRLNEPRPQSQ